MQALPHMAEVSEAAKLEVVDAKEVSDLIARTTVKNDIEATVATVWIAEIKEKFEQVDEKRRGFVHPLRLVIADVDAFFKPALDALRRAESVLKEKVEGYVTSSLATRDVLLQQVQHAPDGAVRTQLVRKAEELVPAKIEGLSIRETWTGEVTDPEALLDWILQDRERCKELLQIDEKALVARTKQAGCDPGIPGWTAHVNRVVAVTPSKVRRQ